MSARFACCAAWCLGSAIAAVLASAQTTTWAGVGPGVGADDSSVLDWEGRRLSAEAVSLEGVRTPEGVLTLDRVMAVEGRLAGEFAAIAEAHDALWRGTARLDRGDWPRALLAFEPVSPLFEARADATAFVFWEALAVCRYADGRLTEARDAWLSAVAAAEVADPDDTGWSRLRFTLRGEPTDLWPDLPPMALQGRGQPLPDWLIGSSELADAYAALAAADAGGAERLLVALGDDLGAAWPGAQGELLRAIALSRVPDASIRAEAVEQLFRVGEATGSGPVEPWAVAWAHTAAGRSLVREPDADVRYRGVATLLSVRVRFAESDPLLASLALAEAALALRDLDEPAGAIALRRDLLDSFQRTPWASAPEIIGWSREPSDPPMLRHGNPF